VKKVGRTKDIEKIEVKKGKIMHKGAKITLKRVREE
jgi:hypothetical protein